MRDNKGRFAKSSEGGMKITMNVPTLGKIIMDKYRLPTGNTKKDP